MKKEIELGKYELEWLEPELDVDPKLDVHFVHIVVGS